MPLEPGVWQAWRSPLFLAGIFLLGVAAVSAGALVWVDKNGWLGDPDPNPIGFGLLTVFAGIAGFALFGIGVSRSIDRERRKRGSAA